MRKNIGPIMLVAGTAIGSGMLALPLVLAQLGLITSVVFMLFMAIFTYYSAIINIELHLQLDKPAYSFGKLAEHYAGPKAAFIGHASFTLLSYSLMAVFIYGGSSVIENLLFDQDISFEFSIIATIYALGAIFILSLPIRAVDYVNRILFFALLAVILAFILGMYVTIDYQAIPTEHADLMKAWSLAIPVVFTSFGYQGSIPAIINYCRRDSKDLKDIFFWGSLLPAIIYIIWTSSVLLVIYQNNHAFYQLIISGDIEVGLMIKELVRISGHYYIETITWWIAIFAILTSALGVGISLLSSLKDMLANARLPYFIFAIFAVLPSYIAAISVPNAFISVLSFAGMILVVIAVILPSYLLYKSGIKKYKCPELKRGLIFARVVSALIVICELGNIFYN